MYGARYVVGEGPLALSQSDGLMKARRITLAALVALCVLAGGLALSCPPALAARGHVFETSFGTPGTGAGELLEPSGVAINEATGDVYVVDKGNNRVEFFSSGGTFEGEFNGSGMGLNEGEKAGSGGLSGEVETGQFFEPEGIAVDNSCQLHRPQPLTEATTPTCAEADPSDGDVYVVDRGHDVIDKFSPEGRYIGQIRGSEGDPARLAENLLGVAVASSGTVWVYQEQNQGGVTIAGVIDSYTNGEHNAFISEIEPKQNEGFREPGFAVDSEGNLYVASTDGGVGNPESRVEAQQFGADPHH